MPTNPRRLIILWCVGLIVGTAVIAATSPLFVRSYLAEQFDSVRDRYVPVPGSLYRWRSEGYATTRIGAHGMPGRIDAAKHSPDSIRVALWGDSQAEGVCVDDDDKLFAQIELVARASGKSIDVLPFARSGEDASHWLTQLPKVERELGIDIHLLMAVDLPDLMAANQRRVDFGEGNREIESQSAIAARVPAFVIEAFRHLLRAADDKPRRLRFVVGPVADQVVEPAGTQDVDWNAAWIHAMQTVREASDRPIVIVYAPKSPNITGGKIVLHDRWNEQFQAMERAAVAAGLVVVDSSDALGDAARDGRWPHGFDNGQIGSGHLNADGYQAIAQQVVPAITALLDRQD